MAEGSSVCSGTISMNLEVVIEQHQQIPGGFMRYAQDADEKWSHHFSACITIKVINMLYAVAIQLCVQSVCLFCC